MAWPSSPRCRSRPPTFIIAAARRIAGTSRRRSISAAIRSCSTISTSRPAATFPIPTHNVKFAHKLDFYREMAQLVRRAQARSAQSARACAASPSAISTWRRSSTTSGATSSCSRSSRTRRSRSSCSAACRRRSTGSTCRAASCPTDEKLYSWWSYRNNDWRASNRGRRLDHILATPGAVGRHPQPSHRRRPARLEAGSDHVPVLATFEV